MNELNYCTRPAAERLQKAGIVMETEAHWYLIPEMNQERERWILSRDESGVMKCLHRIPAPSLAEVWRELPDSHGVCTTLVCEKHDQETIVGYFDWDMSQFSISYRSTNPADAAIDLKIWLEGREGKG